MLGELLRSHWAIIAGQESQHISEAEGLRWASEGARPGMPLAGQSFWDHGEGRGASRTRGVFVFIRAGCGVTEANIGYADKAGRLLRIDFLYNGERISLLDVYTPCDYDLRPTFFGAELDSAVEGASGVLVMGGDWYCEVDNAGHVSPAGDTSKYFEGSPHPPRRHACAPVVQYLDGNARPGGPHVHACGH